MSPPATRPCINCAVVIHARAERCTLCGAEQPASRRLLAALGRYLPTSFGVLIAAGLIATAVAISAGDVHRSDSAHRLFEVHSDMTLVTLVPQNWQGGHAPSPPHVMREVFVDPGKPDYGMTIDIRHHPRGSTVGRARAVLREIRGRPGYALDSYGRAKFPGGHPTWVIWYQARGAAHARYLFSACTPTVSVSVDVSAPTRAELAGPLAELPVATGPRC